jgi:hypothetical protein
MDDSAGEAGRGSGEPSVSAGVEVPASGAAHAATGGEGPAPSEAFQTLANDVRVAVLVELLCAERAGETPVSFSTLQAAAGHDSSAGFAYHLRQLSEQFVGGGEDGYELTPAGRRAAELVVEGAFTGNAGSAS